MGYRNPTATESISISTYTNDRYVSRYIYVTIYDQMLLLMGQIARAHYFLQRLHLIMHSNY